MAPLRTLLPFPRKDCLSLATLSHFVQGTHLANGGFLMSKILRGTHLFTRPLIQTRNTQNRSLMNHLACWCSGNKPGIDSKGSHRGWFLGLSLIPSLPIAPASWGNHLQNPSLSSEECRICRKTLKLGELHWGTRHADSPRRSARNACNVFSLNGCSCLPRSDPQNARSF